MSAKKRKRKLVKHSHRTKKSTASPSIFSRYPRLCSNSGMLLVAMGVLLLSIGHMSNAKIGISMLSLFFGIGLVIFSKSFLPKS